MQVKSETNEQQLRLQALNAMLSALTAQAAAIQSMDREHSLGIENSYSVKSLLDQANTFAQAAFDAVTRSESASFIDTRNNVRLLAVAARRLKEEADKFTSRTQPKAATRYQELLLQLGEKENSDSQAAAGEASTPIEVAASGRKISAQAGYACLRAEIDEFTAFSMQIHAMCNLALEYALNAAAKSAKTSAC
ncbi:MAG: hypothetical protein K2X77_23415 [Candidatus Obscuribacterales bacterium]|jgi:hypothetical protein|nr:hypothetical protein [Candidatus Obscuribacterales bacterium]